MAQRNPMPEMHASRLLTRVRYRCQAFSAESFGPFVEWQVAGDHRGTALVALRDQFEQQLGTGFEQRHKTEFVDDQQFDGGQLLLQTDQAAFVARLHQFVHQRRGGGETYRKTFLAGRQPEPEGNMGFSRAARPKGDDVLAPVDPVAVGQFQHLHLVELWDRLEVEAVQALGGRELRGLDTPLDHPPLTVDQFQLDQTRQELDMIQPLGDALAGEIVVFPQEGWQLQRLEVIREQDLRGQGHAVPSEIGAI